MTEPMARSDIKVWREETFVLILNLIDVVSLLLAIFFFYGGVSYWVMLLLFYNVGYGLVSIAAKYVVIWGMWVAGNVFFF